MCSPDFVRNQNESIYSIDKREIDQMNTTTEK